jgi:hypothetical protein
MSNGISLKEHVAVVRKGDLRAAATLRKADLASAAALRKADQLAVKAAFEAAKEKSATHNDLIQAMERLLVTFVNQSEFKPVADFVAAQQAGSKVWQYVVGIALTMGGFVFAWLLRGGT